ncbi:MAG: YicC/YloC family endoribonuclease [Fimbriiglobus sp.]
MLFSMTGFGEARGAGPGFSVNVEVRAVNNRHLKLTVRGSDPYPLLESELEKVVRKTVRRGTVFVRIHVDRESRSSELRLNSPAIAVYLRHQKAACDAAGTPELLPALAAGVLSLPGVAAEPGGSTTPPEEEWPVVERTLEQALAKLDVSRKAEGRAMADELLAHHGTLTELFALVRRDTPAVTANYRTRILERVRQAVSDAGVTLAPEQVIREVALFADRSDVTEEVSRFAAHLDQFAEIVRTGADGAGRRLEFVVQEMGREANTLGSKAGDVTISRHAVEVKATLEKVRELVQNVE